MNLHKVSVTNSIYKSQTPSTGSVDIPLIVLMQASVSGTEALSEVGGLRFPNPSKSVLSLALRNPTAPCLGLVSHWLLLRSCWLDTTGPILDQKSTGLDSKSDSHHLILLPLWLQIYNKIHWFCWVHLHFWWILRLRISHGRFNRLWYSILLFLNSKLLQGTSLQSSTLTLEESSQFRFLVKMQSKAV